MRLKLSRRHIGAGITALVVLAAALGWISQPDNHTVTITGLEQPIQFVTQEDTLAAALEAEGIGIGAKDLIEPPLETELKGLPEVAVEITRALSVRVVDGGQTLQVETAASTVAELLAERAINLGELDSLSVPAETSLAPGMEIKVTRRSEQTVVTEEEIPFESVTREDGSLLLGTSEVLQAGAPGVKQTERRVVLEDGVEVASEVVSETVVTEPTTEIVAYGTMGVASRGGQEFRYTQEMELVATGYTAGPESNPDGTGLTYTGMRAERGVVAVDPEIIPLYTRLYIEGYGFALAADIGGAIQGNRIDLCFDTVEEALAWGVRPVTVYVLSD